MPPATQPRPTKFQAPKGTRDFYPKQMAWRNHLLDTWRRVSTRNGFEQIDGPIFESLDLYKVKSGDGIVNELFHFQDRGDRELAIRPEFTPTLARMAAAQASALPKPIKWFSTPNLCRAERPQRGRLREFYQWNADILGSDSLTADAEIIFVALDLIQELGLGPDTVRMRISHRQTVRYVLAKLGVPDEMMIQAFELLDRRAKIDPDQFTAQAAKLGLDEQRVRRFDQVCRLRYPVGNLAQLRQDTGVSESDLADLIALDGHLRDFGVADWCEYDLSIVRGLAYYTGTVFELHEASGAERAMAGGGRYDQLVQNFAGPELPAVGFGMGDVVLTNVLTDKGLVPESVQAVPDVFLIAASDAAAAHVPGLAATLRRQGIHARFSYKTTRNVGKLLKEAANANARFAVIVEDDGMQLKNLATGEQSAATAEDLPSQLHA